MKARVLNLFLVLALISCMLVGCSGSDMDANKDADKVVEDSISPSLTGDTEDSVSPSLTDGVEENISLNTEAESSETPSQVEGPAEQDISVVTDIAQYIISHNGKVPLNGTADNIDADDIGVLFSIVLEAVQNLDAEALKPYVDEDTYTTYAESFEVIKADAVATDLWKNTIGQIIYYPASKVVIGKDMEAVTAMWYTECAKNNTPLSIEDTDDLSVEALLEIYNKYYGDAPYIMNTIMEPYFGVQDNGYISVSIGRILDGLGYESMTQILDGSSYKHENLPFNYYRVVMKKEQALSLGYEYIYSEILDFNAIYAMDLDKFVEITNGVEDKYKKGTFWETFEEYYVDTTRRAILMEYLTEECLIYRDLGNIVVYLPVNKKEYPMRALKMDDLKDYESGNIQAYFRTRILAYPENFNNNFSAFDSVADYAKGAGLFD